MDTKGLLEEFEKEFGKLKKELNLKHGLDEFDRIFFFRDYISDVGHIRPRLSRDLCGRIVGTYNPWADYLHFLLIPNPSSINSTFETQLFSDEEKEGMNRVYANVQELITRNSIAGVGQDEKLESEFMDDAVEYWNSSFKDYVFFVMKRIHDGWKKQSL